MPDCFAKDGSVSNVLKSQHFPHPRLISRRLISISLITNCSRRSVPSQSNTVTPHPFKPNEARAYKISSSLQGGARRRRAGRA